MSKEALKTNKESNKNLNKSLIQIDKLNVN
jgi:hypothetical protein